MLHIIIEVVLDGPYSESKINLTNTIKYKTQKIILCFDVQNLPKVSYFNHTFRYSQLHQCDQEVLYQIGFLQSSLRSIFFSSISLSEDLAIYLAASLAFLTTAMQPMNSPGTDV